MTSPFLINYDKTNLTNDISSFVLKQYNNIQDGDWKRKQFNYQMWFLSEGLDLLLEYDFYNKDMNLLEDNNYQNILNTITKIINKEYYGFNK